MDLKGRIEDLLDRYGYETSRSAVSEIVDTWHANKYPLLEKFSQHLYWDEERLAIVVPKVEFVRNFYKKGCDQFGRYIGNFASKVKVRADGEVKDAIWYADTWRNSVTSWRKALGKMIGWLGTNSGNELEMELAAKEAEFDTLLNTWQYDDKSGRWVTKESLERARKAYRLTDILYSLQEGCNVVDETLAEMFTTAGFKAVIGQKTSRVVRQACAELGVFDDLTRGGAHDTLVCESEFAKFSDSINPHTWKEDLIISLNPLDYLTMSFGRNWASCHTIDINGYRGELNGEHTFNGCYSAGTLSYMLDDSTVIAYIGEMENKVKRCNFHISAHGNLIVQGRVYPDARDDEDFTFAPQFRHVVQKVVSEAFNCPNTWTIKKGTENCRDWIKQNSGYCNYSDYFSYEDCNVSVNKDCFDDSRVYVGHFAICPLCGKEHDRADNILCPYCNGEESWEECYQCGRNIDRDDDYVYIERDERYYCCSDCAVRAGYRYCVDINGWSDDYYYDEWDGEYYNDYAVRTEDGNFYGTEENAEEAGYEECYDDHHWYPREDLFQWNDGTYHSEEEFDDEEEEGAV